ncbi:hypothetical protein [Brevifollis gellanilyticus]|nr:hypothetical protein [Brevifollis gellanilyticus]
MAMLAASSLSLAQDQDISGSAHGAFTELPNGAFSTPISAEENRRGAIGRMEITPSGALSLTIRFADHVHHQTGVFTVDENSPPDDPLYVADLGETSGGLYLKAYRDGTGEIALEWRDGDGNYVYAGFLMPAISRDEPLATEPSTKPEAYSTVTLPTDGLTPDDPSKPQVQTGAGYGILLISTSGASVFAGALPDGQSVTGGGQLVNGSWPLNVPMMLRTSSGRDTATGHVAAVDNFLGGPVDGFMLWVKGASPHDPLLPSGGQTYIGTRTAAYTPPARGERILLGSQGGPLNARIWLRSPDRPETNDYGFLEKLFTLTSGNQAVFPAPNTDKLQVNFLPTLGLFTGKVKLSYIPPLQSKTVHFSGVVLQHRYLDPVSGEPYFEEGEAKGFFLAEPQPGTLDVPKVSGGVRMAPYYE